jgi:hypothetical protein
MNVPLPRPSSPTPAPASETDRREQLRLLCARDRASLRLIIHPVEPPATLGSQLIEKARDALPSLLPLAPGMLGRLGRKLITGR